MDQILIQGGRRLQGEVRTSGAKNAALPILASTILGGGECVLSNMPRVVDVLTMGKLLRMLGIAVSQEGDQTVVQPEAIASTEAPYDLVRTMRASVRGEPLFPFLSFTDRRCHTRNQAGIGAGPRSARGSIGGGQGFPSRRVRNRLSTGELSLGWFGKNGRRS